ncbi:MAG: hypothetical protein A2537_02255 [Candidatus Magasanikbacteria bacterium RIFOXYD2_FULL_36_9]|uniref:Uncharacterized protein n=1 Tax=Candidatus Magasanikbacteria bacterium RIFOXYD2_FULL_36_9 TaxID=1798707 RepID=A0A1F6P0Z8_9BACT|nr:MAG: hypothetical protein A2537_02255 [Candidatus Magasanikbacteria bacterium RIFOXYD2_FULL_36_9]
MAVTLLTREEFANKLKGEFEEGDSISEETPTDILNVMDINTVAVLIFGVPFYSAKVDTLKDVIDNLYRQYPYKK